MLPDSSSSSSITPNRKRSYNNPLSCPPKKRQKISLTPFYDVPLDSLTHVFSYLSMSDAYSFSVTCQEMNRLYRDRDTFILINFERVSVDDNSERKVTTIEKFKPMIKKSFLKMHALDILNRSPWGNIKFFKKEGLILEISYSYFKKSSKLDGDREILEKEYTAAYNKLSEDEKKFNFSLDEFKKLGKIKKTTEQKVKENVKIKTKETFSLPRFFILSDIMYNIKLNFKYSAGFNYLLSVGYLSKENIFNVSEDEHNLLKKFTKANLEPINKLCQKKQIKMSDFGFISLYIFVKASNRKFIINQIFSPALVNQVQFTHLFPGKNISQLPSLFFVDSPFRLVLDSICTLDEYLALPDELLLKLNDPVIYLLLKEEIITYNEFLDLHTEGCLDTMAKTFGERISNPFIKEQLEQDNLSLKACQELSPLVFKILNSFDYTNHSTKMGNDLYKKDENSLKLCFQVIEKYQNNLEGNPILFEYQFLKHLSESSNARLRFLISSNVVQLFDRHKESHDKLLRRLVYSDASELCFFVLDMNNKKLIEKLIDADNNLNTVKFIPDIFSEQYRLALKNSVVQDAIFDQLLSMKELNADADFICQNSNYIYAFLREGILYEKSKTIIPILRFALRSFKIQSKQHAKQFISSLVNMHPAFTVFLNDVDFKEFIKQLYIERKLTYSDIIELSINFLTKAIKPYSEKLVNSCKHNPRIGFPPGKYLKEFMNYTESNNLANLNGVSLKTIFSTYTKNNEGSNFKFQ